MCENKQNSLDLSSEGGNKTSQVDLLVMPTPLKPNDIYYGDSFELCERVPGKTVDLILEDMPYNTTACDWDVVIDLQKYWKTRLKMLKPTGVICLTATQPFTTDLINTNRKMFKYEWIWEKSHPTGFANSEYNPLKYHENILVFANGRTTYNPQKWKGNINHSMGKITAGGEIKSNSQVNIKAVQSQQTDDKYPKSVIPINNPRFKDMHETQKPVGLFEYLIRTYTNEGDLVFDGFGGSGTTAIAAHKSNRNFIVIEKEQKYYELAKKRLDTERAQLKMF